MTPFNEIRQEALDLTDKELMDELTRPTNDWKEDVRNEALLRIFKKVIVK